MQEDIMAPIANSPQTTVATAVDHKLSTNSFLVILLSVLLFISVSIAGFFAYQTQKLAKELQEMRNEELVTTKTAPEPTSEPVTADNSAVDQTDDWRIFEGKFLTFKFPQSWHVSEEHSDYFAGNIVTIENKSKAVSIEVTPQQQPYGFAGPSIIKKNLLNLVIADQKYNTDEVEIDSTSIFVNQKVVSKDKAYYVIFGSGYPVNDNLKASISEYQNEKETISQILSTFKFTN